MFPSFLVLLGFLSGASIAAATPGLFIFGDSLVDVGTNVILNSSVISNFPPYGRKYFGYPTGRFSDGRNMADFLAQNLGVPFPLPYLNPNHNLSVGINFASGGSGILDGTGEGFNLLNLRTQLEQFQDVVRNNANQSTFADYISSSLFVICSGGNDVPTFLALANSSMWTPSAYVQNMTDGIANAVQILYNGGARKIVVIGLGPLGCLPPFIVYTNGTCLDLPNSMALDFNNRTEKAISNLMNTNEGLTVVFTKIYGLVNNVTNDSRNIYGLTHRERACCGGGRLRAQAQCGRNNTGFHMTVCMNAATYFFWDSVHPTETAAELQIDISWNGGTQYATPFNISTLVSL